MWHTKIGIKRIADSKLAIVQHRESSTPNWVGEISENISNIGSRAKDAFIENIQEYPSESSFVLQVYLALNKARIDQKQF